MKPHEYVLEKRDWIGPPDPTTPTFYALHYILLILSTLMNTNCHATL